MSQETGWRRFRRLWGADPVVEIDDELRFHLEMKQRELMSQGVSAERAQREAEQAFGDRSRVEQELREIGRHRVQRARRAGLADELRTDLRHTWRTFVRRPGVPLLVIAMLSLGIGAGTAVFSLVDAVVLNPVAVVRPAELLRVQEGEEGALTGTGFAYPMLDVLRSAETHVASLAGHLQLSVGARVGTHAEQTSAALVTGSYFGVLGVGPQHGRVLVDADEAQPGSTPYVVVSDAFWRRVLGADADVIGRTLHVNELALEIVGIAPPRFRGTDLTNPVDLWIPVTMIQQVGRGGFWSSADLLETWYFNMIETVVRLRPGSTPEAAVAELRARHAAASAELPPQQFTLNEPTVRTVIGMPFNESTAARSRADLLRFLRLLAAVVATCLAVACVNVANLMMIRSTERAADMSVRAALGADRGRLFRQLLLESAVLGLAAGAVGVMIALLAIKALAPFSLPGGIALAELSLPLDVRVLAFTAATSLLCAVAFGLAPALVGARAGLMDALRQSVQGRRRGGWHGGSVLLAVQVCLSLVLLVSAGLLIRSLQSALAVDLGYRTDGVAAAAVGLEQHGYTLATARGFMRDVIDGAVARPGVEAAAAATRAPMDPQALRLQVTPSDGGEQRRVSMATVAVTPGYVDLLGLRVVQGRDFSWADDADGARVAMVTESAARRLWPDADAIGQQMVVMFGEPYTVVGVVADARFTRLTETEPHVLLALPQTLNLGAMARMHLLARGDDSRTALGALRASVRARDDRLPTFRERDLHEQLRTVLMPQRFGALLLGAFGGIALLISGIGIYAVAAYDVTRRRRELGIRAALGAAPRNLTRAVLARTALGLAAGVTAGLLLASLVTGALEGLVFGVTTGEPVSYIGAALLLALVATLASWLPARRAARVDPLSVIREQG